MSKVKKKRNWVFILYPESAPSNWVDILVQKGLSGCISPLHDKDINPDGTIKKAHYHVILCYDGPTTYNVVKSVCDELKQPIPQALEGINGYYRYLTHKDNPEKAQYEANDIISFGGFDIREHIDLTKTEVKKILKDIQILIREADIYEYSDLMDILLDSDDNDKYDVASNHTLMLSKYIDSRRNKLNVKKTDS